MLHPDLPAILPPPRSAVGRIPGRRARRAAQELLDAACTREEETQLAELLARFLENSGTVSTLDTSKD